MVFCLWMGLEAAVCLRGSLGSLFTEGWGCDPTWIVVCPEASQCCWVEPDFPKMATSRETHADEYSQELCFQCPSPTISCSHPLFSQEILRELQSGLTQIPLETLLCPGTQTLKVCVCLSRMGSLFPPAPCPSMPDAPGALSPNVRSLGMGT